MSKFFWSIAKFVFIVVIALAAAASFTWFGLKHTETDHDVFLLGMGASGVVLAWAGLKLTYKFFKPLFSK